MAEMMRVINGYLERMGEEQMRTLLILVAAMV